MMLKLIIMILRIIKQWNQRVIAINLICCNVSEALIATSVIKFYISIIADMKKDIPTCPSAELVCKTRGVSNGLRPAMQVL